MAAAKATVLNRLIEPVSENELPNWVLTTALGDLLNVRTDGWAEDRFYRIGDRLLAARTEFEKHLRDRERDLFNLDRTILLYDLTNSYFEGTASRNDLARRSVASKEKRTAESCTAATTCAARSISRTGNCGNCTSHSLVSRMRSEA